MDNLKVHDPLVAFNPVIRLMKLVMPHLFIQL